MNYDDLKLFIHVNNLPPDMSPEQICKYYKSVSDYISHLRYLGLGDFVLMKFKGFYWTVPVENSVSVYLKGGVYVNE